MIYRIGRPVMFFLFLLNSNFQPFDFPCSLFPCSNRSPTAPVSFSFLLTLIQIMAYVNTKKTQQNTVESPR